jgi:hypothetical protein
MVLEAQGQGTTFSDGFFNCRVLRHCRSSHGKMYLFLSGLPPLSSPTPSLSVSLYHKTTITGFSPTHFPNDPPRYMILELCFYSLNTSQQGLNFKTSIFCKHSNYIQTKITLYHIFFSFY